MRWSRTLWLLYSVALLARLAVLSLTGRLLTPEVFEYDAMAMNLLAGRGLVYDVLGIPYASFTGPVYPALCAAVYAMTGSSHVAMVIVQALLSALIPVVAAGLGRELFGDRAGLLAGWFVAVHPGLLIYTTKLHPLGLEALLFSSVAWGALRLRRHPSGWHQGWVGLVLGVAILSRPTALFLMGLVVVWLCAGQGISRARGLRMALGILLIAMGVVLPWTLRNYRIHHRLILVQSTSGQSFWKGNNPRATSGNLDAQGQDWLSWMPPALQARLQAAHSEVEHDRIFWEDAIHYIVQHPAAFFERLHARLVAFWWKAPTTGRLYPPWYLIGYQGWYVVTVCFVMAGVWRSLRAAAGTTRHDVLGLLAFCAVFGLGQSLFYVEGRHRWAIDPLWLVLAGQGAAWCLEWLRTPGVMAARRPS